ncbi:MAG: energy-coupling factor transporter ATPase [Oscillospiraceae bacterium]|jgi:energy-coupling factor transport system ATP-binding protein|nr:energy-coupling factor transporter ATPase [Oscillospiraceae bacterium]
MKNEKSRPLIKAENLFFAYNASETPEAKTNYVLKNICLEICEGSFVAILGHNGSGKSTLAKLMNMILTPTRGKIFVDGLDASDEENTNEVRRAVGMVFQNPDNQLVATIVEEDVAFGPENLGIEPPEIRRRVDEALDIVGMSEYRLHAPHKLSGGQKQRIAIAGVIAMSPKLIILDESTAMLDPAGRKEVLDTIKRLNAENNMTVMLITHYMNEAVFADRVIVLNEGEICLDGTPKQVFSHFEEIKKAGLDVPQVAELMHMMSDEQKTDDALKKYKFPNDVLSVDEAADTIESLAKQQD